jgi:crotonobetainyl-CoA:carnitine CoA-transferase CaiB-like acyl-CoA transferase
VDESRPFAGIEVVEFGQFIAVPWCAQLLAEGGARVIKIEALEGDPVRQLAPLAPGETRHFISRNRGKRTLPLDLRNPGGKPVIERLLARADVVLTNFRPGLAAEMGLDGPTLTRQHPRLVVGNVSAFGARGPDAKLAGMDLVVQARSGFMAAVHGANDGLPGRGDNPPVADYMCAMTLSFGIASALLRRERTGRGGEVDVHLLMAALCVQNNSFVRVESVDGPVQAQMRAQLADLRKAGRPFEAQAALAPKTRTPGMINVYYRTYATKDAAVAVACVSPGLQRALMKAVGVTDTALEHPLADRDAQVRHYAELGARMEALLASRTAAEWKSVFDAHGIPAGAVRLPFEMLEDEQALANGLFHDLAHPVVGPVRVLAPPVRLDGDGFRPQAATPAFGTQTRAILAELGFVEAEITSLLEAGVTREALARR